MSAASVPVRRRGGSTTWIVIVAGLVAFFAVAIVFTRASSTGGAAATEQSETGAVLVKGDSLPALSTTGRDPAVGMSLPEVSGESGFPFFVFVNADGTVHSRFAGELPVDQFAATVMTLSHTTE